MRRLILIICCLPGIFTSSLLAKEPEKGQKEKASIGIDIADIVSSMAMNVEASYSIKEKWTVNARIIFNLEFAKRRKSSEEIEHENMIDKTSDTVLERYERIYEETGLSLRYWFSRAYNGPYISTGGVLDKNFKPDCSLGFGYMATIWKGISLDLMLEKTVQTKQDNIIIRLTYVF